MATGSVIVLFIPVVNKIKIGGMTISTILTLAGVTITSAQVIDFLLSDQYVSMIYSGGALVAVLVRVFLPELRRIDIALFITDRGLGILGTMLQSRSNEALRTNREALGNIELSDISENDIISFFRIERVHQSRLQWTVN